MRALHPLDPQKAEDALVIVAAAVGPAVALGRPLVACLDDDGNPQFVTDTATWWAERGGIAARLVALTGNRVELTRWQDGREIERIIGPDGTDPHG